MWVAGRKAFCRNRLIPSLQHADKGPEEAGLAARCTLWRARQRCCDARLVSRMRACRASPPRPACKQACPQQPSARQRRATLFIAQACTVRSNISQGAIAARR